MGRQKKIESKQLMVSRIFTTAPRDTSAFQENIMIKLIEVAQDQIKGEKMGVLIENARCVNTWGDRVITIHISDIAEVNLYKDYKKALEQMTHKTITYETDKQLLIIPMLQRVNHIKGTDRVELQVPAEIWSCILDFSQKSISMYDPAIAISLRGYYAKRFYEMLANSKPGYIGSYSLEQLNKEFCTKYPANKFMLRILKPAQEELDKHADWSFDYEPYPTDEEWAAMSNGRRGRKPILGWKIKPRQIYKAEVNETKKLKRSYGLKLVPSPVRRWLAARLDFTEDEIANNFDTIFQCVKIYGNTWEMRFDELKGKIDRSRKVVKNPKGYFIDLLKQELLPKSTPQQEEFEKFKSALMKQFSAD